MKAEEYKVYCNHEIKNNIIMEVMNIVCLSGKEVKKPATSDSLLEP